MAGLKQYWPIHWAEYHTPVVRAAQMRQDRHQKLANLLTDLESSLKSHGLWLPDGHDKVPTQADLASTQPFCIDTMDFEVWLQFVLVARFRFMIQLNMPLPESCDIYPMAVEYFKERLSKEPSVEPVLAAIKAIDGLFRT